MDVDSYIWGVISSITATALWVYGNKKKKGYYKQRTDEYKYEINKIEAISKKPTELYRDSFRNLYYLVFLVSFANIMRLFYGVLYDDGVVWQHAISEGMIWIVAALLSLKYKNRVEATYDKRKSILKLEEKIKAIENKC